MTELIDLDSFPSFWAALENEMGFQIPGYIKISLKLCGYDNPLSVSTIDAEVVQKIQQDTKDMFDLIAPNATLEDKKKVFYLFANDLSKFKFLDGHVSLLLKMVELIKKKPLYYSKTAEMMNISENQTQNGESFDVSNQKDSNELDSIASIKTKRQHFSIPMNTPSCSPVTNKKSKIEVKDIKLQQEKHSCYKIMFNCLQNFLSIHQVQLTENVSISIYINIPIFLIRLALLKETRPPRTVQAGKNFCKLAIIIEIRLHSC